MIKYSDHSPTHDALKDAADILEFPIAPDFISHPPSIDPQAMFERIAETMPWRNRQPGEAERRLAEKIPVEFVL